VRAVWAVVGLSVCLLAASAACAADDYLLLQLDGHYVKWGKSQLGTGAALRYAFVQKPVRFDSAINCESMAPIDPVLASAQVTPVLFKHEVAAAFAMWEAATNLSFVEADDVATADILIGTQGRPRGFAFTNVAYDHDGTGSVRRIAKSLICLNPERPWKINFNGNREAYDIRYTIAHEIGHAIGLDHPSPSGELMSFRYGEGFRVLQPGDIAGAVALYGARGDTQIAGAPTPAPQAKIAGDMRDHGGAVRALAPN
jgi:Matrixin